MDEDQLSDADLWELKVSQGMPKDQATAYVQNRGGKKPSRFQSFASAAGQAGLLGFGDEIAGLIEGAVNPNKSIREATAEARANMESNRTANPGASLAGSIAGIIPAAVAPVGIAARGAVKGAGLLGAAARGAGVGAVEGGLLGAGNAEGGVRGRALPAAVGAAVGAGSGAALGGIGGAISSLSRRTAGRGARVANELQDQAGVRVNLNQTLDELEDGIDAVRAQHYRPLEEAFTEIVDEDLIRTLRSPALRRETAAIAQDVAKGERAPSFREAQQVLIRLRRLNKRNPRYTEQIQQLDNALQKAVPGYADADAAYMAASAPQRALLEGRKMYNKASADIERTMEGLSPEAATQFRRGQLTEIVRRLEQRDQGAVGQLRTYMDAGPETLRQMRTLFPDDASFEAFQKLLKRESSAERIHAAIKQAIIPLAATGGAVTGYTVRGVLE